MHGWMPGRNVHVGRPVYKAGVLTTRQYVWAMSYGNSSGECMKNIQDYKPVCLIQCKDKCVLQRL